MRHPQSFTTRALRTAHRALAVAAVAALVALGGPVGAALAAEQTTDAAAASPAPTDAATPIADETPGTAETPAAADDGEVPAPGEQTTASADGSTRAAVKPAEDAANEPGADAEAKKATAGGRGAAGAASSARASFAPAPEPFAGPVVQDAGAKAPIGLPDHYEMSQGTDLKLPAPSVLANDVTFSSGGYLVIDHHTLPDMGTLLYLDAVGMLMYEPPAGFTGTATFTYWPKDAVGTVGEETVVTIDVKPMGAPLHVPPTLVSDIYTYKSGTPLYIAAPGVLANDDMHGDPILSAQLMYIPPSYGSVEFAEDGSFLFTPSGGGTMWFKYRVCTVGGCSIEIDTLFQGTVPSGPAQPPAKAPVGVDDAYVTPSGTALTVPASDGVLANDEFFLQQGVAAAIIPPAQGDLSIGLDGALTYEPAPGFSGQVFFTYRPMAQGVLGNVTTVSIDVVPGEAEQPPGGDPGPTPTPEQPGGQPSEDPGTPGDPEPTPDPTPSVDPDPEPSGDPEPAGDPQPVATPSPTTSGRAEALAQTGAPDLSGVIVAGIAASAFGILLAAAARLRRQRR